MFIYYCMMRFGISLVLDNESSTALLSTRFNINGGLIWNRCCTGITVDVDVFELHIGLCVKQSVDLLLHFIRQGQDMDTRLLITR